MEQTSSNKDFFDQLAADYDQMISFTKSVEKKKNALSNFLKPEMELAADLGCGSGVDSIALASLGLRVSAFDPSTEMIKVAKENAKREGFIVDFHNRPADLISEEFNNKFDIAISLGNTFANIEKEKFHNSLVKCFGILKRGGIILIQILNYEKVVNEQRRIVNITKGTNHYYVRFYDFIGDEIIFNILTFRREKPLEHKLISTKLFPFNQNDFRIGLIKAGFTAIEFFSDFNLSIFNKEQSKDLIIRAIKC
jgi:ubiquinone/menaquinone biosynthesis C-methylase UbiE